MMHNMFLILYNIIYSLIYSIIIYDNMSYNGSFKRSGQHHKFRSYTIQLNFPYAAREVFRSWSAKRKLYVAEHEGFLL